MGIFLSDRNIFTRQEYLYQAEKVLPGEKSFTRLGRWECRRSQAASPDPRGTLKIFLHFPASTFVHLSRHTLPNHRDPLAPSVHNEPFHPSPPRNSPSTELHQQWLDLHLHWVPYLHLAVIVEIDSSLKMKISPPFWLMPSPVYRRCACRRSSPQLAGHAWPWAHLNPPFSIHLNPASPKKVRPSALPPVANIPATFANPLQHRPLVLSYYKVYLADARPPALGISARRQDVVFQKLIASPCFQVSLCSLRFPTTMSLKKQKNEEWGYLQSLVYPQFRLRMLGTSSLLPSHRRALAFQPFP